MRLRRFIAFLLLALILIPAPPAFAGGGLIALTFDDGPNPDCTPMLLDGLRERRVHVTFFVMGNAITDPHGDVIEKNAGIIVRAAAEGHHVASHSYRHPQLTELSNSELAAELGKTSSALMLVLGGGEYMFRPPYGDCDARVCAAAGVPVILWSMDPGWYVQMSGKRYTAENICAYICKYARDGDIILLHDKDEADINGALMVIDELRARGFEFVTVGELLRLRGVDPAAGEVFKSVPESSARRFGAADAEDHWSWLYLSRLVSLGVMEGRAGGGQDLDPDGELTRAEAAALMWRAAGKPEPRGAAMPFCDCSGDDWFASAVLWASQEGLVEGYPDGSFRPGDGLTREQLSVVAARALGLESSGWPDDYPDDDRISPWAGGYIAALRSAGFRSQNDIDIFRPLERARRSEAAEIVCFLIDRGAFDCKR